MSRTSRPSRSYPDPEWSVVHRAARRNWADSVERCAACRGRVDMQDDHYQVVLDREIDTPGKLSFERQRFVFCDEACADEWTAHA
ncbi:MULTISPECIES: hypothetical protein [Haloferax]|uniref:Small CPxCG-related zinc finger protein n=1 Tax=Haloferax marinum TaxID=2666143 RepID=A0A6A8G3K9_9EURY|nr:MULTISPECIES: hypothetical protein [Haloferax]KAB1196151.1 hypothetical protein Hfx1150_00955 [Haloferax sp. CBA1150]MRW95138.1 hypothetical protein [Haloferax marinum]